MPGLEKHIREYRNGRDLTASPRGVMVIDLFGLTEADVRNRFPAVYQHVLDRVKPERDQNNREGYKRNWWVHGEPRQMLRPVLKGLPRYIATVETTKHRTVQFLGGETLPDNMLIAIGLDDAAALAVLSSRFHVTWALTAGGRLGVGTTRVTTNQDASIPSRSPTRPRTRKPACAALGNSSTRTARRSKRPIPS